MSKINIGIVGCGEVTQIIHLPALRHLSEFFEVTALCDISQKVLDGVAKGCPGVSTYTDYEQLVRDPRVDAVLVANPHLFHAAVALEATKAGKDVFIEKPMCMTLAEADALAEAERRTGRLIQIGYMRRYAGAFLEAKKLIAEQAGQIRLARVQDIIGKNALIIADTSNVIRDAELTASLATDFKAQEDARIREAIGDGSRDLYNTYSLLLGLSSHDISALRELLGKPKSVLHATHRWEGRLITAVFDYGDFVCEFATGVDQIPRFDTFIEVYGGQKTIRLDYDTPYVRNLPARLTIRSAHGEAGFGESISFPSRLDSFVVEWRAFYENATNGTRPKTTVTDAREDLEIFLDVIKAIRGGNNSSVGGA